jgi:2'-5' RNA ligase
MPQPPRHGGHGAADRGPRRFHTQADDPPGTSRLFVAVPVAEEVRDGIGALMRELAGAPIDERAPGQPRWVRVDGLHITLRFLGATPEVRVQELGDVMALAGRGVAPFEVELTGGGAFPTPHRPRVLWIGIGAGADRLAELAVRLNAELAHLGWTPDDRPFNPHLTLARTDGVPGSDECARRLIELGRDVRLSWTAATLVLYKSNLGHGPTHYEALRTVPLA